MDLTISRTWQSVIWKLYNYAMTLVLCMVNIAYQHEEYAKEVKLTIDFLSDSVEIQVINYN